MHTNHRRKNKYRYDGRRYRKYMKGYKNEYWRRHRAEVRYLLHDAGLKAPWWDIWLEMHSGNKYEMIQDSHPDSILYAAL